MTPPSFAIAARLMRLPHVWMVQEFGKRDHDLQFLLGYKRTIRLIARLSDIVICCSRAVEDSLLIVAPKIRSRTIYYGMLGPQLPFRPRTRDESLRVALLGRFSESKGQSVAVEATAIARKQGADIELTLVGPGDPESLSKVQRLAREIHVDGHVECKPETAEPLSVWREAHVALMCSREEAFGRVTVEAMKASLPVCGTDSGGTREIVVHETNGLLFPPGDSAKLASYLVRLAADEALRKSLARGAAQTAATYSMARYGRELRDSIFAAYETAL
jgi:glycosyltransferase involved in cell wall biosynthesis